MQGCCGGERERDTYMVGVEAHGWDDGRVRDLRC